MKFIWLSMLFFSATSLYASSFFVENAGGSYVSQADSTTTVQLIKASVGELGHDLADERTKADFILVPKLIPVGSAYVVSLEKWKGSRRLFTSKMKAARFEDMDEIAHRLVRAVIAEVSATKDVRVGDVTEEESRAGERRRPARNAKYFALGPSVFGNLGTPSLAVYLAGAYAFDVNDIMIRIRAEGAFGGGSIFADFGLGASFFLSQRDVAPFIGLDFGYGFARMATTGTIFGESVTGFVLAPLVGVQLLRTSAVNLELALRAAFLLNKNSAGNPMLFTLRVGLYF